MEIADFECKGREIMPKERNTGIDFLRIFAMYLAAVLHVQGHGGMIDHAEAFSPEHLTVLFSHIATYCSVNCFGMISGYVMVSAGFKLKNLIALWMQVIFYSFGITFLAAVTGFMDPNKAFWLRSMFPVIGEQYWYFTAYFGMMLLAPAAIYAVNNMPEKTLRMMLLGTLFFVGFVCLLSTRDPFLYDKGYTPAWLLVLFLAGGYLRRFGALEGWRPRKLLAGFFAFTALTWGLTLLGHVGTVRSIPALQVCGRLVAYSSPTIFASAVMLFLCCERMTFGERAKKWVARLAPYAFGVYLVHTHPVVWGVLAGKFRSYLELPLPVMMAAVLLTAAAIYAASTLIDWARAILFRGVRVGKIAAFAEQVVLKVGSRIGECCR